MAHTNRADWMPDWPGRLNAKLAALYLGVSLPTLQAGVKAGIYPEPVHEGRRLFWARVQLDAFVESQFGLMPGKGRKNSWDGVLTK